MEADFTHTTYSECFNLVIESLLVSTWQQSEAAGYHHTCFNLVIESLLVSTTAIGNQRALSSTGFQSRNRVTFGFYLPLTEWQLKLEMFQSRNRVTFGFYLWLEYFQLERGTGKFQSRNRVTFGFYLRHSSLKKRKGCLFQSRNRVTFGFYVEKECQATLI